VDRRCDLTAHIDGALKFLLDFPFERLARRLAWFDLAARELPFQWETASVTSLRAQDSLAVGDDSADNFNDPQVNSPWCSTLLREWRDGQCNR
jgi:hypothetical protein